MTEQAIKDIFEDFETMSIENQVKIFKRLRIMGRKVKNLILRTPEYGLWVRKNYNVLYGEENFPIGILNKNKLSDNSIMSDDEIEAYVMLYMLM